MWGALGVSATLTRFATLVALVTPAAVPVLRDQPQRGSGPVGVALAALPDFLLASALLVVVDQLGPVFIGMLGGAVAVEQVFAIPGLGRYLLRAANAQDLPRAAGGPRPLAGYSCRRTPASLAICSTCSSRLSRNGSSPACRRVSGSCTGCADSSSSNPSAA